MTRKTTLLLAAAAAISIGSLSGCSSGPSETTLSACKAAWEFEPAQIMRVAEDVDSDPVREWALQVSDAKSASNFEPMKAMREQCVLEGYSPDMQVFLEHEVESTALMMEIAFSNNNAYPLPPEADGLAELRDDNTVMKVAYFDMSGNPANLDATDYTDGWPAMYQICATTTDGTMVVYSSEAGGFLPEASTGKSCEAVAGVWDPALAAFTIDKSGAR